MIAAVTLLVQALGVYLAAGSLFAIAFAWKGAARLDPDAAQGSLGFKLLILPGATALWPLLLVRWVRGATPTERSTHRVASSVSGAESAR